MLENKKVEQYTIDGILVAVHDSISAAAKKAKVTKAAMSAYLLGKRKTPICAGYVWKYAHPTIEKKVEKDMPVNPHTNEYKWESWRERIQKRIKK